MSVSDLIKMLADYPSDADITHCKVTVETPTRTSTIILQRKPKDDTPTPTEKA